MKRTTVKEIYVEIEIIRITKKRAVRERSPAQAKEETSNRNDSTAKGNWRCGNIFNRNF